MTSRTARRVVRTIRLAPVIAMVFSGCTCAGGPGAPPTPKPAAQQESAPAPAAQTPAAQPQAPTAVPMPELTATPAVSAERELCERYVGVFLGREKDPALVGHPEVQKIADNFTDLVMCGAVLSDNVELCTKFVGEERGPTQACRQMVFTFHEIRTYPNTNAFMFTQADWEECGRWSMGPPKRCDTIRDALRANDISKCDQLGGIDAATCRAYVKLDPSLCDLPADEEGKVQAEMKKLAPHIIDKQKADPGPEETCKQTIESKKFLVQGMKAMAQSSAPRDRALGKAGLGDAEACSEYAEAAITTCVVRLAPPTIAPTVPEAAASTTGVPATPPGQAP